MSVFIMVRCTVWISFPPFCNLLLVHLSNEFTLWFMDTFTIRGRLSGLIVDIFGNVAVVASSAAWVEKYRAEIELCIRKISGIEHVRWRPSIEILKEEGLNIIDECDPSASDISGTVKVGSLSHWNFECIIIIQSCDAHSLVSPKNCHIISVHDPHSLLTIAKYWVYISSSYRSSMLPSLRTLSWVGRIIIQAWICFSLLAHILKSYDSFYHPVHDLNFLTYYMHMHVDVKDGSNTMQSSLIDHDKESGQCVKLAHIFYQWFFYYPAKSGSIRIIFVHDEFHVLGEGEWHPLLNLLGRPENRILRRSTRKPPADIIDLKGKEGSWHLLLQRWLCSERCQRGCNWCHW